MFTAYRNDTRTERERQLENDIDDLREQQRRDEDRRYQEKEDHRRERQQQYEQSYRNANDWPEALQKQAGLCQREVFESEGEEDFIGSSCNAFWVNTVEACNKAQEIWRVVETRKQSEIELLEKQLAKLRDSIRLETADKLEASDPRNEFASVAGSLRDDDIYNFLNW